MSMVENRGFGYFGTPTELSLILHNAWHVIDTPNEWKHEIDLFWLPKSESTVYMILYFVLMNITTIFDYV